jgi:hypothetical protein
MNRLFKLVIISFSDSLRRPQAARANAPISGGWLQIGELPGFGEILDRSAVGPVKRCWFRVMGI